MILLFLQELLLFGATQLIGIFVALKGRLPVQNQKLVFEFAVIDFIILIIFFSLFIYFIQKFSHKSSVFFKLIFGILIFAGTQTVLSLILKDDLSSTLFAFLLTLLVLRFKVVFLHNFGMVVALGGIGAVLGLSITPLVAVFLLLILSFYDIIAVYKTGHMVKIAEDMIKSKAISGVVLPQNFHGWLESLENVKPGGKFMILGSGDLIMPLILISSVIGLDGLGNGLIILPFSFAGLFLTYYLFITQKIRRPMAALPPIAVLSIIGYLVSFFIF